MAAANPPPAEEPQHAADPASLLDAPAAVSIALDTEPTPDSTPVPDVEPPFVPAPAPDVEPPAPPAPLFVNGDNDMPGPFITAPPNPPVFNPDTGTFYVQGEQ